MTKVSILVSKNSNITKLHSQFLEAKFTAKVQIFIHIRTPFDNLTFQIELKNDQIYF